jgi:hypothetical protein
LISYFVASRDPFEIEECNVGTGAACGAVFLNRGFEAMLRKKLGSKATTILTERRLGDAMRYFESSIKRNFNPYDADGDDEYELPMGGLDQIGINDDYLKLTKYSLALHPLTIGTIFKASSPQYSIRYTISSINRCPTYK